MKRNEAIQLSNALAQKSLKTKSLSIDNVIKLSFLKRSLGKYIEEMGETEKELADGYDEIIEIKSNGYFLKEGADTKQSEEFFAKLLQIQKKDFEANGSLNFIPKEEINWDDSTDIGVSLVIAEFLIKQ